MYLYLYNLFIHFKYKYNFLHLLSIIKIMRNAADMVISCYDMYIKFSRKISLITLRCVRSYRRLIYVLI